MGSCAKRCKSSAAVEGCRYQQIRGEGEKEGRGQEALIHRTAPAEQGRSSDRSRRLPFATPSVILDSVRDHQLVLKSVSEGCWGIGYQSSDEASSPDYVLIKRGGECTFERFSGHEFIPVDQTWHH